MQLKRVVNAVLLFSAAIGTAFADTGTLRFGLEATYPPFESKTPSGELVGFDIDLGEAVCKQMKVKCVWVQNAFDGLLPALEARKFDVVNSSLYITDKRKQLVAFTPAIYAVPQVLLAPKGSGLLPDLAHLKGKRVGVLQGSAQEDYLKKYWSPGGVEIASYQDQSLVYSDLVAGRINASVQEETTAKSGFLDKPEGKNYEIVGEPLNDTKTLGVGVGFALRKQDTDLNKKVSAALDELKKDGSLSKLSVKWFKRDTIVK
jgi:lysine/arginine/ornithine transport system substrate-binding protein